MSASDELRAMAESAGMEIPQAATLMMGAADTIDRLEAENARLRSELEYVGTVSYLYGRGDLKAENIKLRKLVQCMWPVFVREKRATFADRLHVRAEIDELGVDV